MLRLEKVARRLREATVVGPGSAALGGLAPIATVMLVVAVITVLPWASWTATCTAGVIAAPAAALLGCTVKTSLAAAPTLMLKVGRASCRERVEISVGAVSLKEKSMLRFAKVATPLTAATVVVPERVPLAGLVPIATVMLVVAVVTVLPWASWTATCTAGVIAAPAAVLLGCTVKTSLAAAPTLMLNALLVAPVRPVAVAVSV